MAEKQYKLRSLVFQGKFLQPTKIKISYRYLTYASGAELTVQGIGRDAQVPTKILDAETLLDTSTPGLETSMIIPLDTSYEVTDIVAVIDNIEEVKVRDITLLAIPDDLVANEYNLTT